MHMMNTRIRFSAQIADDCHDDLTTKEFPTFSDALAYAEKNMADNYARVEQWEESRDDDTGLWSIDEYKVLVETCKEGWCDWRNGNPDTDIIPYKL